MFVYPLCGHVLPPSPFLDACLIRGLVSVVSARPPPCGLWVGLCDPNGEDRGIAWCWGLGAGHRYDL